MATPVLQALLLADHVYIDRSSGRHVICGVFSRVQFVPDAVQKQVSGQPIAVQHLMSAGSPYSYISLTELQGLKTFELRFVSLADNSVLLSTQFQVKSQNPLATIELALPLPQIRVPHEGVYALELLCEETLLGAHRVEAIRQSDQQLEQT